MFELRLHDRIAAIAAAAWDALVGPDDPPFVEYTWLDCLEESGCVGGDTGWFPCHLGLYAGSGDSATLVAAAPCYLKTNSEGEFVFDWSWADLARQLGIAYYPKLICAIPFTPASGPRLLILPSLPADERAQLEASLIRSLRELAPKLEVSSIHVLFPPAAAAQRYVDGGFLLRYGVQYHFHNRGYGSFDDFIADQPSKKRTQIRRESRQPALDGVTIDTVGAGGYTAEVVAAMYRIYLTTVDKFTWGRRYLNQRFFELLAARFAHRLAWVVARRDGEIIAGAFNVQKGVALYGRYWGTFVELPFLHFNVCYYHGIRDCISHGYQLFEPGAGGEHKRARGFLPTLTYSVHHLENRQLRGPIEHFLERERAAVQAHIAEE